ncbi:uncharacterized protein EAF02_009645 [Botrytis sinoallii]|uniref:uncharacterized protein n=1 Tax=Botrytis sinoallii TaxID=1463999 RepID=UPI00190268D0|nr:uncharacterized protein EAF02_009645 [Botrytis sinoallii]KAF7867454.1 hypothetical protein EAF02_009645 [Botrytis sinoallii]
MDLVYSNARATIVAASGNSASDGLPGISVPRYQAHADIGETHLIQVSNVVEEITLSKWSTRGWTYQEWYFSRRRLIFADSEVVFLCNQEMAQETIWGVGFYPFGVNGDEFESLTPQRYSRLHSRDLMSRIEVYSRRDLSHDCDSLNAFSGILRHYESAAERCHESFSHLWGVPLQMHHYPGEVLVMFELMWDHEAIAHRRDGLPSWSWSGWGGSVTFTDSALKIQVPTAKLAADENEKVTSSGKRVLRIQISLEDRTIDLYSFCRERKLNLHRGIQPKELHITSFIIPLRFRKVHSDPLPKIIPTFLARPGIFLGTLVCWDREHDFELHKLGLVLPSGDYYEGVYNIIVLHPVADGKYERAGLVILNYDPHTGNFKNGGLHEDWEVLLDENDNLISEEDPKYMNLGNEESNEYLFLQDAEWKTICLV